MSDANLTTYIGIAAGACTTLSFIPQLLHIWKRRSADDISSAMFSVFSFGSLLWLLYGIGLHSFPVMIPNGVTLLFNLSVLFLKWKFSRENHTTTGRGPG